MTRQGTARRSPSGLSTGAAVGVAVTVGAALGGLALAADELPVPRMVLVLVSTGLSWGLAAVLLGAATRHLAAAALAGLVVMETAVVVYYGGNGVLGLRASAGTAALIHAGLVWGALAAVGGPVAGSLGWTARRGSRAHSAAAYGVLAGMLMGQGLYWAWTHGVRADPVMLAALVLPLAVAAPGLRRGAGVAVPALAVSAACTALAWSQVLAAV